ncbi:AMP-binding protein [Bacillus cereus group sp. TH152-1LC]|uniref:AMP-binding protein n=1 Tax=Bacillus cereus group sp. TH152-1LC TaxID=3018060 RepID=UPI0022E4641A|nr:AMP-binding protein [Bacillus cereus group sp. TH152-1LC]MDA1677502.1 AMP-binding protein [Bacillus cereus group sp. TH152-1LC]
MDNVSKREENTQQYRIRKLNEDLIIKLIYVIEGKIDIKEFKKAINSFYQDIINSFELEQVDISYLPEDEQEQYLSKSYLQNQNSYPQSEIAIKGKLIKQNSEKYYLEISGNPYVIDKQAQPLINMISNYSKNNSSNIEGSISYKEIIKRLSEFENSEDSFIGFQHWVEENQLENLEYFQEVDMPFVYENNDSKSTIQRIRKKFEDIEIDKIKATSEKLNLSISDIFLSGWYIWLSKYLSLEHIFVGVNYQGRSDNSSVNIGALDKIIPIEINVNKDLTFKEFAKGLCQKINDFKDYKESFTWQRVESALNCEKVIGIPFSFDHIKWKPFHRNNDLSIKLDDIYGVNEKFKMQLSIIENDDGLTADLYYDTSIASKQDFEVILNTYFVMLGDVLESENKRISELNLLDQRFYNLVVKEWNETESNYNINTCLHSLFEEQVKQTPKSVAIKYDNNYSLNYEQLNERANDLAHQLILNGVQKEEVIGIFMDRSPEVPIGSLGIMKTGAAYVPIDPKFPKERIYKILEDANCRFIITQSKYINDLENFKGIIIPVHLNKDIENGANLNLEVSSRNLAYCIYTSGSTGKPKGALIEHKNIVNHIFAIQEHIPFFWK